MNKLSKLKRYFFPFFNINCHGFLAEKWWFRFLTVLYIVGFVVLLFYLWNELSYSSWGWCYDASQAYFGIGDGGVALNKHFEFCAKLMSEDRLKVIAGGCRGDFHNPLFGPIDFL